MPDVTKRTPVFPDHVTILHRAGPDPGPFDRAMVAMSILQASRLLGAETATRVEHAVAPALFENLGQLGFDVDQVGVGG